MLSLALTFLIVGLVAGLLGLYGVAAVASQIAWVLFLVGVVLLMYPVCRWFATIKQQRRRWWISYL